MMLVEDGPLDLYEPVDRLLPGTVWFNDPHRGLIAIALVQTSDFLFNGGRAEFIRLAMQAAD